MTIILFDDPQSHAHRLKEYVEDFVNNLPHETLLKEFVYVKTLSELFKSMREANFSDDHIDNVISRAASCDTKIVSVSNTNNLPSWYK